MNSHRRILEMNSFWKAYTKFFMNVSNTIAYYTQSEFLLFLFALLNMPLINVGLLRGFG